MARISGQSWDGQSGVAWSCRYATVLALSGLVAPVAAEEKAELQHQIDSWALLVRTPSQCVTVSILTRATQNTMSSIAPKTLPAAGWESITPLR